jgi:hypothetical protein
VEIGKPLDSDPQRKMRARGTRVPPGQRGGGGGVRAEKGNGPQEGYLTEEVEVGPQGEGMLPEDCITDDRSEVSVFHDVTRVHPQRLQSVSES